MTIQYTLNVNELNSSFVEEFKKHHENKIIEIYVLDNDTDKINQFEKMANRIQDARSRNNGMSLEEVIEKYPIR